MSQQQIRATRQSCAELHYEARRQRASEAAAWKEGRKAHALRHAGGGSPQRQPPSRQAHARSPGPGRRPGHRPGGDHLCLQPEAAPLWGPRTLPAATWISLLADPTQEPKAVATFQLFSAGQVPRPPRPRDVCQHKVGTTTPSSSYKPFLGSQRSSKHFPDFPLTPLRFQFVTYPHGVSQV